MFKHILVPLDGSTRAERAIPIAAQIVRTTGGRIDFLRVVYPPVDYGMYLTQSQVFLDQEIDTAIAAATTYLEGIARMDILEGLETKVEAIVGAVAPTLLSYAQSSEIDLIVMYSHGYSGLKRWMLGSVADKVVRQSPVPVLVLREHCPDMLSTNKLQVFRALVTLDGSPLAETALEPAVALTNALSPSEYGAMHLLRVVDVPTVEGKWKGQANIGIDMQKEAKEDAAEYLMTMIKKLQTGMDSGIPLKLTASVVTDIDVAGAIIREAEGVENTAASGTNGYAFIALSTHGRGGVERWVAGSVAERVLHNTQLPILIVRPPNVKPHREKKAAKDKGVIVEKEEFGSTHYTPSR